MSTLNSTIYTSEDIMVIFKLVFLSVLNAFTDCSESEDPVLYYYGLVS